MQDLRVIQMQIRVPKRSVQFADWVLLALILQYVQYFSRDHLIDQTFVAQA